MKKSPVLVPVVPPWIDRTVSQDLDHLAFRVIAPDSSVDGSAQFGWSSRNTRLARAGMPASPVEPPIGPPTQTVRKIMVVSPTDVETIEPDLGLPVGNKVTIRIRNEEQVGRTHQPDSPCPTSTLVSICTLSVKTFLVSAFPSPSSSPSTTTRSRRLISNRTFWRRYSSRPPTSGPFGPKPYRSGFARPARHAQTDTPNPSGKVNDLALSSAEGGSHPWSTRYSGARGIHPQKRGRRKRSAGPSHETRA